MIETSLLENLWFIFKLLNALEYGKPGIFDYSIVYSNTLKLISIPLVTISLS